MSAEDNKRIMSIYLQEVLAQRNFDRIKDIAAPDMVDHTQPGKTGPEALDAHARGFCENTPDAEIDVLNIIADDRSAVGIWKWHGQPTRPSAVSATGSPVVPRLICSVFEIEEGKIKDYRVFVDVVEIMTQFMQ